MQPVLLDLADKAIITAIKADKAVLTLISAITAADIQRLLYYCIRMNYCWYYASY